MKFFYNIIVVITICFFFNSCAKIEDQLLIPDSLPYRFVENQSINKQYSKIKIGNFYDSTDKCDFSETLVMLSDTSHAHKGYCFYTKGFPVYDQDQITFKNCDYKDALDIILLPIRLDYNKNGSGDEAFIIYYKDSAFVQIHDHYIDSNTPYFKYKFTREDNHIFHFNCFWILNDSTQYLVFRKTNRLLWKKSKQPDSLLFINPASNEIKSLAVGVDFSAVTDKYYINTINDKLILYSGIPKNGHHYKDFYDYNSYLVCLDDKLNKLWVDTLSKRSGIHNTSMLVIDKNYNIIYLKFNHLSNSYELYKHNLEYGEKSLIKNIYLNLNNPSPQALKSDSKLFYFIRTYLITLDLNNHNIKTYNLPINCIELANNSGFNSYEPDLPKNSFDVDVNNDKVPDLFVNAEKNQLTILDGKDFSILAATDPISGYYDFAITRIQNNNFLVKVYGKNYIKQYFIEKNPLLTRIKPHIDSFLIAIILLVSSPFLIYGLYKIYYFSKLFSILNTGSKFQGIAVFQFNINKNLKPTIINSNDVFLKIFNFSKTEKKKNLFLPQEINALIANCFKEGKLINLDLSINNPEVKYLTINAAPLKILYKTVYCVLSVVDSTDVVKSEMLSLAISIAHEAKNELGAVQTWIENLIYEFKEYTGINNNGFRNESSWIDNNEDRIITSITEISDTLRKLLYAGDIPKSSLIKVNLYEIVDNWINEKSGRYLRRDIEILNCLDYDLPLTEIDSRQFGFLLQCACDNSADSIGKLRNDGKIIFSSEVRNNNLIFKISDNGEGMDSSILNKINSDNFTTKTSGVGLGMKIIRRVCESHNAILNIRSQKENGTELEIVLKIYNE